MRVVISFTTLPHRLLNCQEMINSLFVQTRPINRIVMSVPDFCCRESVFYEIPFWFPPDIEIIHAGKDLGPAMKLIPILKQEMDPDTCIITVDDDISYDPHLVQELLAFAEKNPSDACGFMGTTVHGGFIHSEHIAGPCQVDILGGYRGVLYRRSFFDDRIFNEIEELNKEGVFLTDDQLFAWHLERNHVNRFVIPTAYRYPDKPYNFKFLNLGGGVYEDDGGAKSRPSLERVKKLYGKT